ncbi:MAG: serine/threonine protein kinase, partial [Deltaproteobacteria bacterium]
MLAARPLGHTRVGGAHRRSRASPSMKICPTCLARHDDPFSRCPEDGAALLTLGADPDPRLGTAVGGGYVLLDVLGEGGMGIVYRAWQRSTAREVAIKTLHPLTGELAELMAARFTREARVTASLRSPHTVTIHDFGRLDDGDFYLVMELLHGQPADVLLETRGALPLGLVREIGVQVCRSLAEAHARGVVHRDLKPSNLVLESTPTGETHAKVLDFGVAKLLEEGTATLTTSGTTVGTVAYMSPEQVEGTGAVGPASDLYALGVTLFELATGERPFVADSRLALMFKHASAPPPPLTRYLAPSPEVEQLGGILERCLAKAPADRFPSADALMRALSATPLGLAPIEGPPAPRAVA